jgi:SAM-dependent methyltransferase
VSHRPSIPFDRVADRYDETRGGEERGRLLAREIDPLLDRQRPALEVGVGTGVVAQGLAELGHRVLGVDLSPPMAARALDRLGPVVAVGDAMRLPVPDAALHQAYSVWVLHLVGDQSAVLAEVARVLGPEGRYVVAPGHLARPEDEMGAMLWDLDRLLDPDDRRVDDAGRLRSLAPGAGLHIIEERLCPPRRFEMSPEEIARNMEERVYSILWDVDDATWHDLVEPVIERLREMPDPNRPRTRVHEYPLIVLERPA